MAKWLCALSFDIFGHLRRSDAKYRISRIFKKLTGSQKKAKKLIKASGLRISIFPHISFPSSTMAQVAEESCRMICLKVVGKRRRLRNKTRESRHLKTIG
jgi:hypothetical protein